MEALTELVVYSDGNFEPEIEPKTEVILVQDGIAKVGRFLFEKDVEDSLQLEHPNNEEELNAYALELIKAKRPDALEGEDAVVVICPKDIAVKMEWN